MQPDPNLATGFTNFLFIRAIYLSFTLSSLVVIVSPFKLVKPSFDNSRSYFTKLLPLFHPFRHYPLLREQISVHKIVSLKAALRRISSWVAFLVHFERILATRRHPFNFAKPRRQVGVVSSGPNDHRHSSDRRPPTWRRYSYTQDNRLSFR